MAAAPTSSAAEEVAELDRLLFRLVMTPEERIGGSLQEHLPLLLDRLGTEDAAVRNKVRRSADYAPAACRTQAVCAISFSLTHRPAHPQHLIQAVECCSHLLKRLRADSALQVPCTAVLERARAPGSSVFTKNFAHVFLEVGVPRLGPEAKGELARALLVGIGGQKGVEGPYGRQAVTMAHRLLELLEHLKPVAQTEDNDEQGQQPSDRDLIFVQELFLDLLFVPNATFLKPKAPPPTGPQASSAPARAPALTPLPPGLTREALDRLASHPSLWTAGVGSGHGGSSQAALAKVTR